MTPRTWIHDVGETRGISGGAVIEDERVLEVEGEPLLVAFVNASLDTSCCGVWGCRQALVVGRLLAYHSARDGAGRWLSAVEPLDEDSALFRAAADSLRAAELVQEVRAAAWAAPIGPKARAPVDR